MSDADTTKDSEPLFFGFLEGLCFFCLFLSPLLAGADPGRVWIAVALVRVMVLGGVILPCRGASESAEGGGKTRRFLGRALLYQAPFWISALLFPLTAGQTEHALSSLGLQVVLMVAVLLLARWGQNIGVESLVFVLTFGWMLGYRPPGLWLVAAALASVFTFRQFWSRPTWGSSLSPWQSLAVGAIWLVGLAMPVLGSSIAEPGATPLYWVLLMQMGAWLTTLQQEASENREGESSVPSPAMARLWLEARRSAMALIGWWALLVLVVQRPQEALACGVLLTAWWRALELATRGWFTADRLVWWVAGEITLVWLALETTVLGSAGVLVLTLAFALAVRSRRALGDGHVHVVAPWSLARLEALLTSDLRKPAPANFAKRVWQEAASHELDTNLTAVAPAGFRERLLQRLRETENSDER